MLKIKAEPELQHVLSHFRLAIDYLAEGNPRAAQMEMQAIESMIEFDSVEEQESFHGCMQGQDEERPGSRERQSPAEVKTEEA